MDGMTAGSFVGFYNGKNNMVNKDPVTAKVAKQASA